MSKRLAEIHSPAKPQWQRVTPLRRFLPPAVALIMTFVVFGAIHDLVTMAIRQSGAFLFTLGFFLLGAGVVVGRGLEMDYSARPWLVRAGINLTYILSCLAVTLVARQLLAIP